MPIRKEDKHRYPPDWKERRARVLKRAKNKCELCGAPNGKEILRYLGCNALWGTPDILPKHLHGFYKKPIKVILTVAHLDPTYTDHDEKFLLALCQRCHLKIDAHVKYKSRERNKNAKR